MIHNQMGFGKFETPEISDLSNQNETQKIAKDNELKKKIADMVNKKGKLPEHKVVKLTNHINHYKRHNEGFHKDYQILDMARENIENELDNINNPKNELEDEMMFHFETKYVNLTTIPTAANKAE